MISTCSDCNNLDVYVNLVIDVFVLYTILNTKPLIIPSS